MLPEEKKYFTETFRHMAREIENRKYDLELKALGLKEIVKIGIAFKGKEVKIGTI